MKDKTTSTLDSILRQKAEELLKKKSITTDKHYTDIEIFKLVHELDVHQIELEMQNEELRTAKINAEIEAEKYTNLYDFAPSGYLTLSKKGEIVELNFRGAILLGKERSFLQNKRFGLYITDETRPTFNLFLEELFESKTRQTCEIMLSTNSEIPIFINLTGIVDEDGDQCFITMIDISQRKKAEEETKISEEKYRTLFETNRDSITIFRLNNDNKPGNFIEANPATTAIFGYTKKELLEMNISSIEILSDKKRKARIATLIAKGRIDFETIIKNKKGNYRVVEIETLVINYLNEPAIMNIARDITDRKQIEENERKAQEYLVTLLQAIPDLIFEVDLQGNIYFYQAYHADLLAIPATEIMGKTLQEVFPIDAANICIEAMQEALDNGWSTGKQYSLNNLPQGKCCFEISVSPIQDTESKDPHFIMLVRDITERKKAEKSLQENKENLQSIFDSVTEAIYIMDETGTFIDVNKGAEDMYQYSRKELVGKTPELVAAKGLNDLEEVKRIIKSVFENGIPITFEFWAERKNGAVFPKEIVVNKGTYFSKEVLIVTARDITERKKSEEKLRFEKERLHTILELVGNPIFLKDNEHRVTYANNSFYTLFGLDEKSVIGKTLAENVPENEREHFLRIDRKVLDTGVTDISEETLTVKGKLHTIITSKTRFIDAAGNHSLIGSIYDITERKRNEEALQKSQEKLRGVFDLANSGIILTDLNGKYLLFNNWCTKAFGYTRGELNKLTRDDLTHPDDAEKSNLIFNQLVEGKIDRYQIEKRYVRKDKSYFWAEISVSAIKDKNNKVVNTIGILNDITQKRAAKVALEESAERLIETQELAKVGSWETDFSFENAIWSRETARIYGIDENAPQFTLEQFLSIVHPEDRLLVQTEFVHSIKKNSLNKLEHRIITPAGIEKFVEQRWIIARDTQDQPVKAVGSCHDITERKVGENKLKESKRFATATLDALSAHIAILDENGYILAVNTAWNNFRLSNSSQNLTLNPIIGENYLQICECSKGPYSEEAIAMAEGIHSVMEGKQDEFSVEYPCHSPTEKRWFNARVTRFAGEGDLRIVIAHENITHRKLTEELVEQSKTRFSSIINGSPVAMALNDEQLNITFLNPAFIAKFGYTLADIPTVGDWLLKAYPDPIYRTKITETWLASVKKVNQTGEELIPLEVTVRCKNGSDKTVMANGSPLLHSNEYINNFYDITERKLAEQALENQKRRLATILIGTGAGTWEWNVQTGSTIFNDRWAEMLGYKLEELLPISIDTWRKFTHPDDLKYSSEKLEKHLKGELDYYECEFRMKHKNGEWVWILDRGKINTWDVDGKPLFMSGTHQDITNRKIAEEKLIASESLLKKTQAIANIGSYSLDLTTEKWTGTAALDKIFGVNNNFERTNDGWQKILHPDWRKIINDYMKDEVIDKKLNFNKEYKIITFDRKKERWVHGIGEIILNPDGQPIRLIGSIQDVTERKIAEETLRENEEKYRSLVENSPDGVVIYIDDKIAFINGEGVRMLGAKSKKEIIGKPVLQFVHPESLEDVIKRMKEIVKDDYISASIEERFIDLQGNPFDVEVKGIPTTYEHRNAVQIIVHDITQRKQTSLELSKINRVYALISQINNLIIRTRNQEELFQEICNIAVDFGKFRMSWIGLLNDDLKILTAAYAGHETGYFTKSNITTTLDVPEGRGPTGTAMREGRTVICNDIDKDKMMKPWRKDALERGYYSVISIPIIVRNKIIGAFNLYSEERNFFSSEEEITLLEKIILNISFALEKIQIDEDRKKTEEKIRQLSQAVEQSPVTIVITNTKGEIEYANHKFFETTGYSVDEILGKNPSVLKSGYTSQGEYKNLWQTIGSGHEWHGEFHNKRKDGTLFWESATISPIINTDGKTTHFIAIKEDITSRKNVEKELIKSKERAEESDRLKLAFLANMSHEIRTPMNGILGFTELLKEPKLSGEEQQEYINIIEKSGKRMLNIINDIISISKVESGQIEVTLSETNINEQIDYIYTFFKPEAKLKGIEIFVSKQLASKDNFIKTDREKVYAVLTNLVKNALKFTNEGSIEFGCEKKGNNLEFFIKDTGLGISKSQKKIIFERFRQANETISRTHEGSGLGLAISKAYVEMLGGKIWVESKEGKGSTFYFTIPLNSENKLEEKNGVEKAVSVVKDGNTIKDLKVLIVEDDAISKLLITIAVKPYSKEILKVSTGIEAIEACRNNPDIDLVMMDINMPKMGGYEATKLIREFNKELVIIAQTANGMQSDRDDAIAAGCTDYISKPINITSLGDLIQKYFDK